MINEKILNYLHGHWKYQQTVYNINNQNINCNINHFFLKTQYIKQNNNHISNNIKNIIQYYNNKSSLFISTQNTLNNIYKNYDNKKFKYDFKNNKNSNLSIKYKKNNISFYENLHLINSNFFISQILVKKNDKYIAVIFTSYIKIIGNDI